MDKMTQWKDTYRGVPYAIKNWKLSDGTDCWAYYLYLNTKQLEEDIWLPERKLNIGNHYTHDYEDTVIGNLDWHCGCTYYEKHGGYVDGENKVVEVGCDYQHYWDEGHYYDEEIVQKDVKDCIDSLHNLTKIKRWCIYCGEYFLTDDDEQKRCPDCVNK